MNQSPEKSVREAVGARTTMNGQALDGARANVEHLLAAFRADPGGEAGQMARIMLLNYMIQEQNKDEEQTLRELLERKVKQAILEEDVGTLALRRLNADTRSQKLGEALRQARAKHAKIDHYLDQAQKALAEKRPFDYERALNQISAVIGLRGPEEFLRDEAEGPADSGREGTGRTPDLGG